MPSAPHNASLHRRINVLLLLVIIAIFGAIVLFSPKSNGSRPHENASGAGSTLVTPELNKGGTANHLP